MLSSLFKKNDKKKCNSVKLVFLLPFSLFNKTLDTKF